MHRNVLPHVGLSFVLALAVAMPDCSLFAQDDRQAGDKPPVYFPYPPGLMPADLQSEIDRTVKSIKSFRRPSQKRGHCCLLV